MGQSYPIYACPRANHTRYSSVQVTFCGSLKQIVYKSNNRETNLTGGKCRAYGTMS